MIPEQKTRPMSENSANLNAEVSLELSPYYSNKYSIFLVIVIEAIDPHFVRVFG